jgi:hypothetical protein
MRTSPRVWIWIAFAAIAVILLWLRISPPRHPRTSPSTAIRDLSVTNPLSQPGGAPAPADAYEVYSALYQAPIQEPVQEPIAFANYSFTDIPQVDGVCLKPSTPQEREMTDAFVAANQQSHPWEQKFTIPDGYQLLSAGEVSNAETCLETHGQQGEHCDSYKQLRHVRFLGVPGFDHAHTRALVSVIKKCGRYCGSGGIFEAEKTGSAWQRAQTTDFTRDCSWIY